MHIAAGSQLCCYHGNTREWIFFIDIKLIWIKNLIYEYCKNHNGDILNLLWYLPYLFCWQENPDIRLAFSSTIFVEHQYHIDHIL